MKPNKPPEGFMPKGFCEEHMLEIMFDTETTVRSPYKLYGCPEMWKIGEINGFELFARYSQVQERTVIGWEKVAGISYQWQKDGKWTGQGLQSSFKYLMKNGFGFCT
jgi:hypothetical protein